MSSGDRFLWKDKADGTNKLVILTPNRYNGQIARVEVIDAASGRILEVGRFSGDEHNGARSHWRFNKTGAGYGNNVVTRVVMKNGGELIYNIGQGGRRHDGVQPSSAPLNVQQSGPGGQAQSGSSGDDSVPDLPPDGIRNPLYDSGSAGGIGSGNQIDAFGNLVNIPNFVDFNPSDYHLFLDQAIRAAEAQGNKNVRKFFENFEKSEQLAFDTQDTELTGLEKYLPRSSKLITQLNEGDNTRLRTEADRMDARNAEASRVATDSNVTTRSSLFESFSPGTFQATRDQSSRAIGDQDRIRNRSRVRQDQIDGQPDLLTPALEATAARTARNTAADRATVGGFGVDSSASRNLLDRVDFEKRLELEQLNREDRRRRDEDIRLFDNDIRTGEAGIRDATNQAANLFQSILAPGIVDTAPIQTTPIITDLGTQVSAVPRTDAGTLRAGFTSELTNISTLAPSQVFSGDLDVQRYNSGVDLQALAFEQDVFNTISAGINNLADKSEQSIRDVTAAENFDKGIDDRKSAEEIAAYTEIATTLVAAYAGSQRSSGASVGTTGGTAPGPEAQARLDAANENNAILAKQDFVSVSDTERSRVAKDAATIKGATVIGDGGAIALSEEDGAPVGYVDLGVFATETGERYRLAAPQNSATMQNIAVANAKLQRTSPVNTSDDRQSDADKDEQDAIATHQAVGELSGGAAGAIIAGIFSGGNGAAIQAGWIAGGFAGSINGKIHGKLLQKYFGSGKNTQQRRRDVSRDILEERGVATRINGSHHVTLFDGTTYNIGVDGENKIPNIGVNIDGKTERFSYEIDFSNPIIDKVISWVDPVSIALVSGNFSGDFVGHLVNAVTSNDPTNLQNARRNIQSIMAQSGIQYADGVRELELNRAALGERAYSVQRNNLYDLYFGS